ncbi:DUF6188 family protein [Flindersiella endophytica]
MLVQSDGGWVLPLAGYQVTRCSFDHAVTLLFENDFEVTIESAFVLRAADGGGEQLVPGDPPTLAPALTFWQRTAASALAYDDGRLELRFGDGGTIDVPSDERYEAWNLTGPGGLRVVSMPGGELAIWTPS